jgi:hypothetical protein
LQIAKKNSFSEDDVLLAEQYDLVFSNFTNYYEAFLKNLYTHAGIKLSINNELWNL